VVRIPLAVFALFAAAGAQEPLFDGRTLQGFTKRGGPATYTVEDGAIVGRSSRYPNAFLCTERSFGDFEFELEFQVAAALNSGVQIRSEARPDGAVFGYQVEIDPSERAWSGGIYDESRRGWLDDLQDSPAAREAFRQGEWNRFRIVCEGPSLRTWINGVPAADLLDAATLDGFVALQVHGTAEGAPPREVRWRGLRIVDRGRHEWVPLFDGRSLAGFEPIGGGTWRVEDGILVGEQRQDDPRHGVLLADGEFGDFAVRIVYRAVRGNSGLYFRCEPKPDEAVIVHGFQAEIDAEKDAGMLYETGGRARVQVPAAEWVQEHFKAGDWNEMVVIAQGRRVKVLVNGATAAELRDDPGRLSGRLGLQLHGSQDMRVEVRSLGVLRKHVPKRAGKSG
jgi:hypothetical protein